MQYFTKLYWQTSEEIYMGIDPEILNQNECNIIIY